MLYKLLYFFHTEISALNVFRYITFRTILSALTAMVICILFGKWAISKLKELQVGQHIRMSGPKTHMPKAGTPTMGGVLILTSVTAACLAWGDMQNIYVWIIIFVAISFGAIGFLDDYIKKVKKSSDGLGAKSKLALQTMAALFVAVIFYIQPNFDSKLTIPFFKDMSVDLGLLYIPFIVFIIVGTSNAVNLTDGLDGLAITPFIVAVSCYVIFSYIAGNIKIAGYLQLPYVFGAGETAVVCGALAGAGLGFLWFNGPPAEIFMGDVGSLSLGAMLGSIAVITKQEIILAVVGGLFVVEAMSVIIQVIFFKLTGGKRVFRMAPIHHHFEEKGWVETKVVIRFWIIAIVLALLAMSSLKLR